MTTRVVESAAVEEEMTGTACPRKMRDYRGYRDDNERAGGDGRVSVAFLSRKPTALTPTSRVRA
jgi:hypothetical protein